MKTAEEYLKENGLKNQSIDSGISGGGSAPMIRVSDIMKRYSIEVSKQALINASKSAKTCKNGNTGSWYDAGIDKQSIINESNIPVL